MSKVFLFSFLIVNIIIILTKFICIDNTEFDIYEYNLLY